MQALIEHRAHHNQTIILDRLRFQACRFVNCDLRYRGGAAFVLRDNVYEGFFNLEFAMEAEGALALLRMLEADLKPRDLRLVDKLPEFHRLNPHYPASFHAFLPRSDR